MTRLPQPSNVFPPTVRDMLVRASQVADPHQRLRAIDHAIDQARRMFPNCFKPEAPFTN